MIIVTGTLHARPDSFAQVSALTHAHVKRSRTEVGCIEHGFAVDAEDPMRLVFFERWADRAAIDAHLALPASREFGKAVAGLVDQPPTLSIFGATELPLR
jgi:quinol monooxygenase YgiN